MQAQKYARDAVSHKRDVELSHALLIGLERRDNGGLPYLEFLSGDAENDARRALCRLLVTGSAPRDVLRMLADVFEPSAEYGALKAILKRRSRGHANH